MVVNAWRRMPAPPGPAYAFAVGSFVVGSVMILGLIGDMSAETSTLATARAVDLATVRSAIAEQSYRAFRGAQLESLVSSFYVDGRGGEGGLPMDVIVSVSTAPSTKPREPPADGAEVVYDPFADPDPLLTVGALGPDHMLLLNKYNVFKDHVLITTRRFKEQRLLLEEADLQILLKFVTAAPAVGFFNSGWEAGASQPHRHMQAIPADVFALFRPEAEFAIPVDEVVFAALEDSSLYLDEVAQLDALPYSNAVWAFGERSRAGETADLREKYVALLESLELLPAGTTHGDDTVPLPHNLIMTGAWMMVIPRNQRMAGDVDVNALGFTGSLLARVDPDKHAHVVPREILCAVGRGCSSR
mmetsp:Transcript_25564/g.80025  ORF Transcript_25564/g.80025 Transcript_25564/m.80025 type:complete len:359 (-) Transcript_25564:175-1251(-)